MKPQLGILIATIAAATCAATAWAGDVPDSASASRFQAISDEAWRVKVKTAERSYLLMRPRVDAFGITPDATVDAREPIPWERIQLVETQQHARGRGFAGGFVLGALVSTLAVAVLFDHGGEAAAAEIVLIPIVVGTGGLVGAWIGASTAHNSETVYP